MILARARARVRDNVTRPAAGAQAAYFPIRITHARHRTFPSTMKSGTSCRVKSCHGQSDSFPTTETTKRFQSLFLFNDGKKEQVFSIRDDTSKLDDTATNSFQTLKVAPSCNTTQSSEEKKTFSLMRRIGREHEIRKYKPTIVVRVSRNIITRESPRRKNFHRAIVTARRLIAIREIAHPFLSRLSLSRRDQERARVNHIRAFREGRFENARTI